MFLDCSLLKEMGLLIENSIMIAGEHNCNRAIIIHHSLVVCLNVLCSIGTAWNVITTWIPKFLTIGMMPEKGLISTTFQLHSDDKISQKGLNVPYLLVFLHPNLFTIILYVKCI